MRKILVLGLMFGTLAAWNTGCAGGDDDDDDHEAPVSIAITPDNPTVSVGSSLNLTATGTFEDQSTEDLTATSTWTSSSAGVATVGGSTGVVTGVSAGTTTITAEHDGVTDTTTVTVTSGGAAAFDFTIGFNGGWPHGDADSGTGVRVIQGAAVVYCNVETNVGAAWEMSAPGILQPGMDYTIEVFGDAAGGDNDAVYSPGDHTWTFPITDVAADYDQTYLHAEDQLPITWPDGTACP